MMRQIISLIHLAKARGKHIYPSSIYVQKSDELPVIGESVLVTSKLSGKQFAGTVTSVDEKKRTYGATVDLGTEIDSEMVLA